MENTTGKFVGLGKHHVMEPVYRPVYEALRAEAGKGRLHLNHKLHRYMAVAKEQCMGWFSSLELACMTVDANRELSAPGVWESFLWEGQRDYVLDTKTGQYFFRVSKMMEGSRQEKDVAVGASGAGA